MVYKYILTHSKLQLAALTKFESNISANSMVFVLNCMNLLVPPRIAGVYATNCCVLAYSLYIQVFFLTMHFILHPCRETFCRSCGAKFPVCIASGTPLVDHQVWVCSSCRHRACEREIMAFTNCPLCHHSIDAL